ncbi:FMN-dependent dehydrogenase [Planotetraspora silvatica]|uniref:FMN-dependent dehydrogenase n=1 Tax=Planotetraspora silvatica TaxID=234614 RepID=A0A8J3UJU2_9ACTN|nr:alpha-hydroxy acid oxidase [Planotetraspora silvatica]GII43589.1 FMN-dependent dehydrogenase [Planotetraspora silvatica]
MNMSVARAVNVDEVRELARRRLPRPVFDLVEGGAEDEITMRGNLDAFRRHRLLPRAFADVASRDSGTTVLGTKLRAPILLAPTGAARVLHRDAELAVARAARASGLGYVHGTVSGHTPEQVAAVDPFWFQLYASGDRPRLLETLKRIADVGFRALVVTVDVPVFGNRERDRRNRLTIPLSFSPVAILRCATRPRWTAEFIRGNLPQRAQPDGRVSPFGTQRQILSSLYPVTADDLAFIRDHWQGPLLVKGILHPADCETAIERGANGIIVSNHGGRQLDRAPAALDALPVIVSAAAGRAEVLLDGGVRRGTDILTALALGARAVLVGRPYLYGLAAGGQEGVERVLEILVTEFDRAMALTGFASTEQIDGTCLMPVQ